MVHCGYCSTGSTQSSGGSILASIPARSDDPDRVARRKLFTDGNGAPHWQTKGRKDFATCTASSSARRVQRTAAVPKAPLTSLSSQIDPNADILSSRPDLSGVSGLDLNYAKSLKGAGASEEAPQICTAATNCLAHPVTQEIGALPAGTSAPNTVITEHAMRQFHIRATTSDWLIKGTQPFSAVQIATSELTASTSQLSVESKNDQPTSFAVIGWATIFGIVIALGVLGMSVGLVRSETASDLRTLAATGASSNTRRTMTAVTAGALGFLGALLGVVGGYIGMIGWLRSNSLNGGIAALGNIPVADLLFILLGMPAFAAIVGWLFAGREPAAMAHQAIE